MGTIETLLGDLEAAEKLWGIKIRHGMLHAFYFGDLDETV